MKKLKYIYILIAALALSSCNYLDIEPKGQVIPHSVSEYRALLTEGYLKYPHRTRGVAYLSVLSDEIGDLVTEYLAPTMIDISVLSNNYTWEYQREMYEYDWEYYYRAIFQANSVINEIMDADEDNSGEDREQVIAEAYALRAYAHFYLVNLYGKWYDPATAATDKTAPLSTYTDIEQKYVPSTVEKMYELILSDLEKSKEFMEVESYTQATDKNYSYRFSKDAITAFESRVRLYKQDWQRAYDMAKSLTTKYTLTNLNDTPATSKLPWEADADEAIMVYDRPFNGADGRLVDGGDLSTEILSKFIDEDLRKLYIETKDLEDSDWNVIATVTVPKRSSSSRTSFRVAEMYLTAAEAAVHIGASTLPDAKTLLKELQKNRFSPAGMATKEAQIDAMSGEQLLAEIADERAREFLVEGHRWFDLRRTTRPEITKVHNSITYTLQRDDIRYTLPFPTSAIKNNTELLR